MAVRPGIRNPVAYSTVAVGGFTWVTATCQQVGCERYRDGWSVRLDPTIREAAGRIHHIRWSPTRRGWVETTDPSGVITFTFPPETPCFHDHRDRAGQAAFQVAAHRRRIRPNIHVASDGTAQQAQLEIGRHGRPAQITRTFRPQDWAESLAERWNKMATLINGG